MSEKIEINGKFIHPAIQAAVSYWCDEMPDTIESEKLEIFRESLSLSLAKLYDSKEGIIEIHSKVPDKKYYTAFEKPNKPSQILIEAAKKSKLKPELIPQEIVVTLSTTIVEAYKSNELIKILWKKSR